MCVKSNARDEKGEENDDDDRMEEKDGRRNLNISKNDGKYLTIS